MFVLTPFVNTNIGTISCKVQSATLNICEISNCLICNVKLQGRFKGWENMKDDEENTKTDLFFLYKVFLPVKQWGIRNSPSRLVWNVFRPVNSDTLLEKYDL